MDSQTLTLKDSSTIAGHDTVAPLTAHNDSLPPSPPLAGAPTLRNTRSSARRPVGPAAPTSSHALRPFGGAVEHATVTDQSSVPFGVPTYDQDLGAFSPAEKGAFHQNLPSFTIGAETLASPSFDGGAPFDLAQYVHESKVTPLDLNHNAVTALDGGHFTPGDMQSRASGFDATLESPLEFDLDYSPFAGSSSDFTPSPWEAPHGTPQLSYSSLFDPLPSTAGTGQSLDTVFPELSIHPSSTVGPQSFGVSPLFASPSTAPLELGPIVTAFAHDDQPTPQPSTHQQREEQDDDVDDYDDGGEYQPEAESRGSPLSSATRSSRKRKLSATNTGRRDPTTGKRVFHGVRTHATVPVVPLDAPIQPRNYKGDSKTSRKVLPKAINKTLSAEKRRRDVSVGIAEGDDLAKEIDEETREEVDLKRKANTLAARKSRMRKAEYLAGLEERVKAQEEELEALREENEQLRARVGQ